VIRTLVRKELQEHAAGLTILGLSLAAVLTLILIGAEAGGAEKGPLDALREFVILAGLLGSVTLGQMLVAREYTGQTQLFLETLPLRRSVVLATKLLLGAAVLLIAITLGFAVCAAMALRAEDVGAAFAAGLWVRAASLALFLHSFFFAFNLLGRYRVPCLLMALLAFAFVAGSKEIDPVQSGPLALLDHTFASERQAFPWGDLAWTWGGVAAFVSLGFVLGLTREGAVAALLAQSMSQREKAFMGLLAVGTVLAMITMDARREKKPYDLQNADALEGKGVNVKLSPAGQKGGLDLVRRTHGELVALREYLGASSLTPVFLSTRLDLDDRRYERGAVGQAEGLLVRIHYPSPRWSDEAFLAWVARETVVEHTRRRARLERNRWVLDGLGLYWTRRAQAGQPLSSAPDLTLRALYGTRDGFSADLLDRWLTFRERVGDDVASAVAWSGLQVLAQHAGAERVRSFLSATLGRRPPDDLRATWEDWRHPLPQRLERETGLSQDAFLHLWSQALEAERRARRDDLHRVPILVGSPVVSNISEKTRGLSYAFSASTPLPPGTRVHLRHLDLPLFDVEINPSAVRSEDRFLPLASTVDLPGTYVSNARLAWTFALHSDVLGCEVLSGWKRQVVP
jgi:hypothetical protein